MINIQIEDQEIPLLKELLTKYLSHLKREIAGTESKEWLADLRKEEALMVKIMEQIAQ